MKKKLLLALTLVVGSTLRAQFYAPETDFHDISQRTFPVEAARVLAWLRNADGGKIAEVTFKIDTTPERETVWTIQWLDAEKKSLREKSVRYPETLLVEGPKFYRTVFAQLTGDDWMIESAPPDGAAFAYWRGAELAGAGRLESLRAAGLILAENPKVAKPADAAQLAGLLAHGALAATSTLSTLDSVLLSRAAAWTCVAERRSREEFDAHWCPVLWLAGREKIAAERWLSLPAKPAEQRPAAERYWDFMLRPATVKDAFLFAARPENKAFAMPVMSALSAVDSDWTLVTIEVADDVLGEAMLARLHEWMPSIVARGGVNGGHFGRAAPGQFLAAWESAMRDFKPGMLDFTGYRAALGKTAADADEEGDAAIQRLAPALNLGLNEATGALIPVAYATARDLLGYGWEMAACQFGAQHDFLEHALGDHESARATAVAALGALKGA